MARLVVTGSTGFVGTALLARAAGVPVVALRLAPPDWERRVGAADFREATVVHLAARVHEGGHQDEAAFERDNVGKTEILARAAVSGGARRIVFLSSVKAVGEETPGAPFDRGSEPRPSDAYGRTKRRAEVILDRIASETGLEVATVRAPLVYGAVPKGNLAALLRLADTPLPLPLASVRNRRSFVHVDDLARLLLACAAEAAAAGRTYYAAYPRPASTADAVTALRRALGRPARLVACPPRLLEACAALAGQARRMRRLTRSLEVDPSDAERELGWRAAVDLDAAAAQMAAAYRRDVP